MNRYRKSLKQRILAIAVAAAMVITLIPATAAFAYAATAYDYQPVIPEGDNMNSMIMLEPSDITVVEETDTYILNRINEPVDGTKDIKFTIAMSAGMNNFSESNFLNNNMPIIKIYNSDGTVAAEYKSGAGDLEFLGSLMTDEINNHGGNKTRELYLGVDQGVLDNGKYVIEFGKNLCGNNTSKILGKDIRFEFNVKATEDLDVLIKEAEELLNPENIGDTPGKYPQSAADDLQTAIDKATAELESIDAKLAASTISEETAKEQKEAAALELDAEIKEFKSARVVNISITDIDGVDGTQYVGDQGTASAAVSADVEGDQYKKVKWEASDNIIIDSVSGEWIAAYAGEGWIRAVSTTDNTKTKQIDVNVINEDGIVGVMLADKDVSITDAIESAAGGDVSGIESLKLFTAGNYEFAKSDVTAIREAIPNLKVLDIKNVKLDTIGNSWFAEWNSLEKVVLPDNLTTISIKAFYNCKGLKTVDIPATVDTIGSSAFAGCTSLNSTMTVYSANPPAFATAVYENLKFGDSFKGCEDDAAASVKTIRVPYGCKDDFESAEGWKRYSIVEMNEKALTVEYKSAGSLAAACEKALKEKGWDDGEVTTLTITSPSDVALEKTFDIAYLQENFLGATVIDFTGTNFPDNNLQASTFEGRKNVKEIKLPSNITNIGRKVFYGCSNMRTLTIPEALRYTNEKSPGIGESALADCDRLTTMIILPSDPPGYMGSMPATLKEVYVPNMCVEAYKDAFPSLRDVIKPVASVTVAESIDAEVLQSVTLEAAIKSAVNIGKALKWEIISEIDADNPVAVINEKTGVFTGNYTGTVDVKVTAAAGTPYECSAVTTVNITRPAAVTLAVDKVTVNSVSLLWSAMENAAGYQVWRADSKDGEFELIQALTAKNTTYKDNGLTTGKTYYYKVRGYKMVEGQRVYSEYSTPVTAFTSADGMAMERYAGTNRFQTAYKVADQVKVCKGVDKFEAVVVASGLNYPDALAGSYLAKVKNAPILLVGAGEDNAVKAYIQSNLKNGGTVYILGGPGAVSESFEMGLKSADIKTERLSGTNRYDTNIAILNAAGASGQELLICSGAGYADSLSASAVGKPILLVDKKMTDVQMTYLEEHDVKNVYLVGGTGAVSADVEKQLKAKGYKADRFAGKSRYETSAMVAEYFFGKAPDTLVLAYAQNFPDGLSGGPLAMELDAPLLLVDSNTKNAGAAKSYAKNLNVSKVVALGGAGLVPDSIAKYIAGK